MIQIRFLKMGVGLLWNWRRGLANLLDPGLSVPLRQDPGPVAKRFNYSGSAEAPVTIVHGFRGHIVGPISGAQTAGGF